MSVITGTFPRQQPGLLARAARRVVSAARRLRGLRELLLLAGLYVGYCLTRVVAADDLGTAQSRARFLVRLEGAVHLDIESWVNHTTSQVTWLAVSMDYWYCVLHYLVTPAILGWLYLRRRGAYAGARNALVVASVIGLLGYLVLPTAPPRLLGGTAYLDTLAEYAHYGWWSAHASAPSGLGGLTNELAAMPSLHVGWAVWVAWVVQSQTRARWRGLVHLYPVGTALVVIGTGNHWVLDCAVGVLVTLAGIGVSRLPAVRRTTAPLSGTSLPSTGKSSR